MSFLTTSSPVVENLFLPGILLVVEIKLAQNPHRIYIKLIQKNTPSPSFTSISKVFHPVLQELCTGFSRVIGVTRGLWELFTRITPITLGEIALITPITPIRTLRLPASFIDHPVTLKYFNNPWNPSEFHQ